MFKRVAVVEKFFDIIYSVHVESSSEDTPHLRGRAGKHCGQKRTYRAVSLGLGWAGLGGAGRCWPGLGWAVLVLSSLSFQLLMIQKQAPYQMLAEL